eukprot:PITA_20454
MVDEYDSIVQNNVWDVVPRREKKSIVRSHWRFKVKQVVDGSVEKHQMDMNTTFLNGNIEEEVYIEQSEGFETFHCNDELIMSCKEDLASELEMKDMGLTHYFLGMEVWEKDGELFVSKGNYANEILGRFHMEKCKPMQNPLAGNWRKEDSTLGEVVEATMYRHLVGSLMYLVNT